MIRSFANSGTEDVFRGKSSKAVRKTCPTTLLSVAARKLDQLNQAEVLEGLRVPPANRLEKLRADRIGTVEYSDQRSVPCLFCVDRPGTERCWDCRLSRVNLTMTRLPTHRAPTHPGEMLLEEFLQPLEMTQTQLAERIGVSYPRINEIVKGKRW